jgi:glycosyltransferase involved in cell wall biosynthesis
MATYNGAKYIEKQLNSILNQTLSPAEIIICDDNSTDGTVAIIKTYLSRAPIQLSVNEKQLGVVANFKKAAGLANRNNWVAFADQDDVWLPQKLQLLADEMGLLDDATTPALIYSDLIVIDKNDNIITPSFWVKQGIRPVKVRLETLLYGNVVTGCTMLVNHAMIKQFLLMDAAAGYLHDEWFALVAYSYGKVKLLNEQLILYRQHDSNETFSAGYDERADKDDLNTNLKYITGKKKFLPHQFKLVKAFFKSQKQNLGGKQIAVFENFMKQENKNYLLQRINRRIKYL